MTTRGRDMPLGRRQPIDLCAPLAFENSIITLTNERQSWPEDSRELGSGEKKMPRSGGRNRKKTCLCWKGSELTHLYKDIKEKKNRCGIRAHPSCLWQGRGSSGEGLWQLGELRGFGYLGIFGDNRGYLGISGDISELAQAGPNLTLLLLIRACLVPPGTPWRKPCLFLEALAG